MESSSTPLAERMRPRKLEDFVGQEKVIGQGTALFRALQDGQLFSIILWGPPGTGKTTLAGIIANRLNKPFYQLSAVSSGVKDVREVLDKASRTQFMGKGGAVLFIDEIHRFNKSQQDSLLAAVEKGLVTLIGATTENPGFEVNAALLSRCEVYVLESLPQEALKKLVERAISEDVLLKNRKIVVKEWTELLRCSGGDARKLLNNLEIVAGRDAHLQITDAVVLERLQKRIAMYDRSGDQHYDIISAFIKSIRGSDPNAAVYWLARMIEGGEDPKFIARRLIILASEDIGLANPTALVIANNCFMAVERIGMPEGRIVLAQTAIYLATSPKSNASYMAIGAALEEVRNSGDLSVPLHLRNASNKLMKQLGYGENYVYAHHAPGHFANQEYLPEELSGKVFYQPSSNKRENENRVFLQNRWKDKYNY